MEAENVDEVDWPMTDAANQEFYYQKSGQKTDDGGADPVWVAA